MPLLVYSLLSPSEKELTKAYGIIIMISMPKCIAIACKAEKKYLSGCVAHEHWWDDPTGAGGDVHNETSLLLQQFRQQQLRHLWIINTNVCIAIPSIASRRQCVHVCVVMVWVYMCVW